jgi:hypothetical protein
MTMMFKYPMAQAEYERLLSTGVSEGDAHQEVELNLLAGMYIPRELQIPTRPRMFAIVGSSDKARIARKRGIQEMAENDPDKFDQYSRQARAAGVDITGKSYCSGLAAYPGDPDGWAVDDTDIKHKAELKGMIVGKEDGLLKLTNPIPAGMSPSESMLKRKRISKPVMKKRRPKIKGHDKAGSYK